MIAQARIPRRYEHCTLDSYEFNFGGANRSLGRAYTAARKFVAGFPLETDGTGLLLTGSIGVGKTHLAVGILQGLIAERGATGIFCDYRELLKEVQNSYSPNVAATELEVLKPVFEAEVLVLDEIGASKPTEWVWDTVAHILNSRYNDRLTTILTTNYANLRPAALAVVRTLHRPWHARPRARKRWETVLASACGRACRRCASWWRCRAKIFGRR